MHKIINFTAGATLLTLAAGLMLPDGLAARGRPPAQAGSAPAASQPADLDRLLAPVALYPDQLLSQMLLCATKPAKVSALHEWMAANSTLKGSDLQDAAVKSGFDQSFAALVLF